MIRCLEVFTQRYTEFFDFDCVEMSYTERFTILIFKGKTLGEPEIWGINSISGDEIVLRLVQKTKPEDKDSVARALRHAVKVEFDKANIKLASGANAIYVNVKN